MDTVQNETEEITKQIESQNNVSEKLLKIQQEQWISYCALWGLMTYEPDSINPDTGLPNVQDVKAMTVSEFADKIGVGRASLYRWKKSIPDFGEKVRAHSNEVFTLSRESVLFNRAYLIALTSRDHKAAGEMIKMLLGHGAKLELPVQRQEIDAGQNLIELANIARKKGIIEGEVVESTSNS